MAAILLRHQCDSNMSMGMHAEVIAGIILGVGSDSEKWHYNVTSSLIGWGHTQNDPCIVFTKVVGWIKGVMNLVTHHIMSKASCKEI